MATINSTQTSGIQTEPSAEGGLGKGWEGKGSGLGGIKMCPVFQFNGEHTSATGHN